MVAVNWKMRGEEIDALYDRKQAPAADTFGAEARRSIFGQILASTVDRSSRSLVMSSFS